MRLLLLLPLQQMLELLHPRLLRLQLLPLLLRLPMRHLQLPLRLKLHWMLAVLVLGKLVYQVLV